MESRPGSDNLVDLSNLLATASAAHLRGAPPVPKTQEGEPLSPAEGDFPMHRLIYAIVVCTLFASVGSGQGPGDCLIVGAQQVECGSNANYLGSLPVAVFPYAANWSIINNNTGATIVGSSGCASVPVPIGACPVSVNVGTVGTFELKLTLT